MRRWLLGALFGVAVAIAAALVFLPGGGEDPPADGVRASAGVTTTAAAVVTAAPGTTVGTTGATTAATTRPGASTTPSTSGTVGATAPRRVAEGTWGGRGIRLVVGPNGGSVEYDCGAGVIGQALVLDGTGSFQAEGTHSSQRGGPVQPGTPAPAPQTARYTGRVDGSQMQLTVVLLQVGTTVGPFTLGLDQQPLLDRCG